MHENVARGLAAIFLAIAALHFYWAVRGVSGASMAVPARADGKPLFLPSTTTTMMVVVALVAAAVVVLGRAQLLPANPVPISVFATATWLLGLVFTARAIGELRYVGLFKRVRGTAFARADTRYFTPLCIVIASGVFYLAARPIVP